MVSQHQHGPKKSHTWQPQFTLSQMLRLMFLIGTGMAGGYYAQRAIRGETDSRLVFVLFSVSSPVFVLVAVSLFHSLTNSRKKR